MLVRVFGVVVAFVLDLGDRDRLRRPNISTTSR